MQRAAENRGKYVIMLLFLILFFLILLKITAQNELIGEESYFILLRTTIEKVKRENILFHENLLMKESFVYIASRAAEMGFVPIRDKDYIYLKPK